MIKVIDYSGNEVILPQQRCEHIIQEHPEIEGYLDEIKFTLKEPDLVKRSKRNENVHLYYRFFKEVLRGKYILVVVKISVPSSIITCYIADKIKEGEIIWQRK